MLNLDPVEVFSEEDKYIYQYLQYVSVQSIGGLMVCLKKFDWEEHLRMKFKIINLEETQLSPQINHIPSFKSRTKYLKDYYCYSLNKSQVEISFENINERYKNVTSSWLENFPWEEYLDVCLAGGTCLNILKKELSKEEHEKSDIDLFVLNNNKETVESLINYFENKFPGKIYYILQGSVLTLYQEDQVQPLQIILTKYNTFF